ncbi:MAG: PilZ domain-containing protein [Gammaproteobacteria bacterium]|nr:PilZ domain-containing protein [Gammaproteobacteria bacterium]
MFWKKKQKSKITVELADNEQDYRAAYRVKPSPDLPAELTLQARTCPIVNISGTGCCFRSEEIADGAQVTGTIRIEGVVYPITLRVVAKQNDLCRCQFIKTSANTENALHHYVLKVQKSKIRG